MVLGYGPMVLQVDLPLPEEQMQNRDPYCTAQAVVAPPAEVSVLLIELRDLSNATDEGRGDGTSALSPRIARNGGLVGIGALKRVILINFITAMNSHGIYAVNLPD